MGVQIAVSVDKDGEYSLVLVNLGTSIEAGESYGADDTLACGQPCSPNWPPPSQ